MSHRLARRRAREVDALSRVARVGSALQSRAVWRVDVEEPWEKLCFLGRPQIGDFDLWILWFGDLSGRGKLILTGLVGFPRICPLARADLALTAVQEKRLMTYHPINPNHVESLLWAACSLFLCALRTRFGLPLVSQRPTWPSSGPRARSPSGAA